MPKMTLLERKKKRKKERKKERKKALQAAVDTPFLLAFPRAALFSANQLFVSQSIGFRSFYEVFYKSAEISGFFFKFLSSMAFLNNLMHDTTP